jgi:putative DNA primase/helicase
VNAGELARALEERGIRLKRYQPGEHRAPCPECNRGKRDDALAVRIDHDGATWLCHRCEWSGGIIRSDQSDLPSRHQKRTTSCRHEVLQPEPKQYTVLAPWAARLWALCQPIEPGTISATYLEQRGCALPPDDTHLRWHPCVRNPKEYHVGPALVALVTDVETGDPTSLHRTWLAPDGSGKAALDRPRLLAVGHRSDGVIRLWPDDAVTLGLVIGEGVETCLAAARAGLTPVWGTISAGNMTNFPVLPGLEGLTVLVDHDKCNPRTGRSPGIAAARAVIARYAEAGFDPGRDIKVIFPPTEGQDAADLEAAHNG